MLDFDSLKREEPDRESSSEWVTFGELDKHLSFHERLVNLETEMNHRITVRIFYLAVLGLGAFFVTVTIAAMQFLSSIWFSVLRLVLSSSS